MSAHKPISPPNIYEKWFYFCRFKTKSSLKTHLKIHSEVKPHACEVCGKRFRRKGTLTRHQSVHSDALPFECEYCKKCFRMKTFLKVNFYNLYFKLALSSRTDSHNFIYCRFTYVNIPVNVRTHVWIVITISLIHQITLNI